MLNPRSGLVRAGVRADFQLATVVVAAALFACIATSAALGADVEWDFRSPDLESGRETVTLSEPFTIATRFSFADVSLGDDSKWVAWLAGIATESDGIPEGVFIEWVGEKLLWSTTWKLRLVSSVGALMPSSSSGQRDSSTTVLSGNKPIAGHSYRAVMSYGSAEQELSVLVEDLTAGSVLYSGHFDVGNQAEHAPDEALLAGAGWARYGKGGETSGSSFVRFETVSLDLAYERLGLPFSMKQEFDSYLVRHQPGLPDSPAKVTGSVIWEDDLISIEMVWPKTRVEGSVEVTCVSGDREVELVTAEWSDKRQSHMLDLSGVPCGEMTIALRYVIGEERTLIVERGLTKRAVTAGVEGKDYRNFFGPIWFSSASEAVKYARQMGNDYILYKDGMERNKDVDGMLFYLESPEYSVYPVPRLIYKDRDYTPEEIALYEEYFAWKSDDPFPNNMATGFSWGYTDRIGVEFDLQQQKVIDYIVDSTLALARRIESDAKAAGIDFRFGGIAWDVPAYEGSLFWSEVPPGSGRTRPVPLSTWTGKDSTFLHEGITHEHETFIDGAIAYYKTMFARVREVYPHAKFVFEPWGIYDVWNRIRHREDLKEFAPDFYLTEGPDLSYLTGEMTQEIASVWVGLDKMGSTSPDVIGVDENRAMLGQIAVKGAWFCNYGHWARIMLPSGGEERPWPTIPSIPDWFKLMRQVANWDNLSGVPLSERQWNGVAYESTNSCASPDVIYSRQPRTGKIFAVFMSGDGVVRLRPGEEVVSVSRVDGYFVESEDGMADVAIADGVIRLANMDRVEKGFIIVTTKSGVAAGE
jgi:hypothetical protein